MGTRDALLQIQMGTYTNGVTCYYTFPYTNNVLIGPTPYVRRVWGAGTPVSPLLRRPPGPIDPRARQVRRGYPIRAPWKPIYRSFHR